MLEFKHALLTYLAADFYSHADAPRLYLIFFFFSEKVKAGSRENWILRLSVRWMLCQPQGHPAGAHWGAPLSPGIEPVSEGESMAWQSPTPNTLERWRSEAKACCLARGVVRCCPAGSCLPLKESCLPFGRSASASVSGNKGTACVLPRPACHRDVGGEAEGFWWSCW